MGLILVNHLRSLLNRLPHNFPLWDGPDFRTVNPQDELDEDRGLAGSFNYRLESIFERGKPSDQFQDQRIVNFQGRGPALTAVVDVLEECARQDPHESAVLQKWVDDLISSAKYTIDNYIEQPEEEEEDVQEPLVVEPTTSIKNPKKRKERSQPADGNIVNDLQHDIKIKLSELTDQPPKKMQKSSGGRPRDPITYDLVTCYWHLYTNEEYWRCAGPECLKLGKGKPQKARVLGHVMNCPYVTQETRDRATEEMAKASAGHKLSQSASQSTTESDNQPVEIITTQSTDPVKKQSTVFASFLEKGKENLVDQLNHDLVMLICREGLVPRILGTESWSQFIEHTRAKYNQPCVDTFTRTLVPAEACRVRLLQKEAISNSEHLTLTYDGGGTRKHQSVYTVHVTTPSGKVYFLAGEDGTGRSHNTKFVVDTIAKWASDVGVQRIAGIGSDSTAVTKNARRDFVAKFPFIINFGDPCHHLNLTIKDLSGLSPFAKTLNIVKSIIAFFEKSDFATNALMVLRKQLGIGRGLESIGNTRFGTHYWAAASLHRCLDAIRTLVQQGKVTFGTRKDKNDLIALFKTEHMFLNFKVANQLYLNVIGPIARTIECFESNSLNFADIFMFWVAIAATLRELLAKPEAMSGISPELAKHVTTVVNRRYKEFIDDSPTDVYFTAFFLDPRYRCSDILRRPSTMSETVRIHLPATGSSTRDSPVVPIPRAFMRTKECLKKMAIAEIKAGPLGIPLVKKIGPQVFLNELKDQLIAYACEAHPFKKPWNERRGSLGWWRSLVDHDDARTLAALAIKIYSVVPHSMADERTMSTFTWFNSALRNRQELGTLVNMTQVRQWHNAEAHGNKKRHPVVKWRDLESDIFFRRCKVLSEAADEHETPTEEENNSMNEQVAKENPKAVEEDIPNAVEASTTAAMMDTEFVVQDLVDLRHPQLLDLLSDDPVALQSAEDSGSDVVQVPEQAEEAPFDLDRALEGW